MNFSFCLSLVVFILLIFFHLIGCMTTGGADDGSTIIGAIIDANSRKGKEETAAMKIAVDNLNSNTRHRKKFSLVFRDFNGQLNQAALITEELIKEKKVQVIVGMDTWQQAALAAEIGSQAQVPVVSLAASAGVQPPSRPTGLIQMGSNVSEQITFISAIVGSYHWRRVVAIYEDDAYGGNAELLALLSEALGRVGSQIEYHLSLPLHSSLSDPTEAVRQQLSKLLSIQSRVFIVLQSSVSMATYLFREARQMDFMGKDSAWIFTDSISSFLESMNASVIRNMEGALGIKSYYSKSSKSFLEFSAQFQKNFTSEYPEEENPQPGIHGLRAYDAIDLIARALERSVNGFAAHEQRLRIVNIVGKGYTELDFWTQDLDNPFSSDEGDRNTTVSLGGAVIWPGYLKTRVPKGWEMPSDAKPLKIAIPTDVPFKIFVKVDATQTDPEKRYTGFCIDIFREIVKILEKNYSLPYNFTPVAGTYDDLVDLVNNKTFDAVVGDITMIPSRSMKVDFTLSYAESGLVIVQPVPEEPHKAWMFMKPFTREMWLVTGALLVYTMFIVWVVEHQSNNPAFRGPWNSQLATALSFTFSSLFFAHREEIRSNITRVVIMVWLLVVFVLISSYTASLSSILTVRRLEPDTMDLERLKATKSVVGCNGNSYLREYLESTFDYDGAYIKNITDLYEYPKEFQSGNISAAVFGVTYAKIFINKFCKNYTAGEPLNRFGGLGFAFQKGSPLVADVSEAILFISEQTTLKALEEKWFPRSRECSTIENDELSLQNFWALYILCGATSTLCFLVFFFRLLIHFNRHWQASRLSDADPSGESIWMKTVQLVHFFHNGPTEISNERSSNLSPRSTGDEWVSQWWSTAQSHSDAVEPLETTSPTTTETVNSTVMSPVDVPEPPHLSPCPSTISTQ